MFIRFVVIMILLLPQLSCMIKPAVSTTKLPHGKTVIIFPFTANNRTVGEEIADYLREKVRASRFTVIAGSDLQRLLAKHQSSPAKAAANITELIGKLEGVDAFIIGTATQKVAEADLLFYGNNINYVSVSTARVIDAKNGELLMLIEYKSAAPSFYRGISTPEKTASYIAEQLNNSR